MAKRMFRRRGFGRRPVVRERLNWLTSNFNEQAQSILATLTEFNIYDPAQDIVAAAAGAGGTRAQLRRIIVNGGVAASPGIAAVTFDQIGLVAAIYVRDTNDTDASLITTAQGDILEGGTTRLLWTHMYSFTHVMQEATKSYTTLIPALAEVNVDLRVRVNLRFDEVCVLGMQFMNVPTTIATASYSGCHRALYQKYY